MDLLRSLPLGLYLEQPITWMHRLDPRIKLVWLMTFLAAPLLANPVWRIALVGLLIALTFTAMIPLRVWRQQMGWLLLLSVMVLGLTAIMPDGLKLTHQPRLPADELAFSQQPSQLPAAPQDSWNPFHLGQPATPPLPGEERNPSIQQPTDYNYILFTRGPIKVTRRSLDLAVRFSTLLFTLIYSTNLFLLTTAPEEITAAIENWMEPLRRFKVPVTEIALTLTLSLRFIPLVLEETQNLIRSVWTRAINWRKLGMRASIEVWLMVAERLLENLLLRAEQIASAMKVRGFTSPNQHRVEWYQFRFRKADWLALAALVGLWSARLIWGWEMN
ncbi:energy-coupling factor transporter transmembrane protein EcfT [Kovacikia minuta CCNUW1]|uniref:energy-coupling factor transporter transmembrane component T family protein n=1 Tax=Kovacikia minuta TaxID=2931930 RepID=UPI001CCB99A4|nr:energy-coupling factor transporter transmembrane protein EcfT [Kovacikia minuta]UBF23553.1 energy-coupling factor transporter transmembrane protein EcfT [Kovacikia minuta CCNUW1]